MTPTNIILSMIRKRLIAMNRYTELNVQKVFNALTDDGKNLNGAVMTSKPEVLAVLDKNIKEILNG